MAPIMRSTAQIMGMPVAIEVIGDGADAAITAGFAYFRAVDAQFSPFKPESEVSALNRGEIDEGTMSATLHEVLKRCETTRWETRGYFDIRRPDGGMGRLRFRLRAAAGRDPARMGPRRTLARSARSGSRARRRARSARRA